jgi:hypothetical protein
MLSDPGTVSNAICKEDTDSMGSQVGGNLFLAKPVKAQEMVDTIEQLLDGE